MFVFLVLYFLSQASYASHMEVLLVCKLVMLLYTSEPLPLIWFSACLSQPCLLSNSCSLGTCSGLISV